MNKKTFEKYITIARDLKSCNPNRCKHFTFVVKKNTVLSIGTNKSFKTHPVAKQFGHRFESTHSEIDACSRLRVDWSKITIINIRINKYNEVKLSKPCKCCLKWLESLGVKRVFYSTENGFEKLENV